MDRQADDRSIPPALHLHQMAFSLGITAALVAAARLGVADAIGTEPVPVEDLAKQVDANPESLDQLMRALAVHGVFAALPDRRYEHTEMSRSMRADAVGSRRPWILLAGAPFAWQIWSKLDDAVRTGRSLFPELYGKDMFAHLSEDDPELSALFDTAAATSTAATATALAEILDLSGVETVADVGGGQGKLLRTLLERNPHMRGVLFDTPRVLADADPALRDGGALAGRCAVVAGDVHREVPVVADLYVFKGVLHMWNDDTVAGALSAVRRSAPAGARVVIVEQLVDATPLPGLTTVIDLLMLASQGGKERTTAEFRALFERAGLEYSRVTPAGPVMSLVEATVPGGR
jgi:C-methyltransferase